MTEQTDAAEVARANLAAIMHELETPMRGHDEDGRRCRAAHTRRPGYPVPRAGGGIVSGAVPDYAELVADLLAEYGLTELPPAFLCRFDGSVHKRGIWHEGDTPLIPAPRVPSTSEGEGA